MLPLYGSYFRAGSSRIVRLMDSFPTRYWHRLDDGRVQCDVCPRACKLREGQRGLCFVRAARGRRRSCSRPTAARAASASIPIEKKPLNHFLPGTPVLSFGTAGCNLACKFCQNWDISKSREMDTLAGRARAPRRSRAAASSSAAAASPSPTTIPSSSWSTRSTSREACHAARHEARWR